MGYRWTLTDLNPLFSSHIVLDRDPIGWDDGVYTIKRSEIYKGAFQEYTTSLKFHCDGGGKGYIDNIYERDDIDGRIDVLIEYDCDSSGTYDILFNGIINLASYQTDGEYTTVNIEKSDLLTKLYSRDEIGVDLESITSIGGETITSVPSVSMPMHSTMIEYFSEWVIEQGYQYNAIETYHSAAYDWQTWFTHLAGTTSSDFNYTNAWTEFNNLGSDDIYTFQTAPLTPIIELNTPGVIYPLTVKWEIDFSGTFSDYCTIGGTTRDATQYKLIMYYGNKSKGGILNTVTIYNGGSYSADPFIDNFNIVDSGFITLNQGDEVYLTWFITYDTFYGTTTIDDTWEYNRSFFRLSSKTFYKETTAKTFLVHEAFNQVVDAIADSNGNFYSDFYGRIDSQKIDYASNGCGSEIAITNGLNIREFENIPIVTSFKDLFEGFDCIHNIGMGMVDGLIRVEPISYFYDGSTKIITLEKVAKYSEKNSNIRYINKVNIGYSKWESEFHGGLDDPISEREYSTMVSSVKNTYSKLCNFIASTFTIEFTRRKNKEIDNLKDWKYDNDIFLIALSQTAYGGYIPQRYNNDFSGGVNMGSIGTAYNIRLTPARMLLAHMNVITAGLQLINGVIKFVSGKGNYLLKCIRNRNECQEDYSESLLSENQDFQWDDSNALNSVPIWETTIYSFEYPLTYQEFKTIKANPYGYIEFYKFLGQEKRGFILSMDYSMKTGMTKFELLKAYQ